MSEEAQALNGMLVAGQDGSMFWIPVSRLESFRLPDDVAEKARDAMSAVEPEVAGFGMDKGIGDARVLAALQGPIGIPKPGPLGGVSTDPDDEPTVTLVGFKLGR